MKQQYDSYKPSGIDWIGDIPSHWETCRFQYALKEIKDGTHFSPEPCEDGYPYITAADVRGIGLDYSSAKKISESDFISLVKAGCGAKKGDVLLVKDGATTGRVGYKDDDIDCVTLSSVAMLRGSNMVNSKYLMHFISGNYLQHQILVAMAGAAMPRITLEKINSFNIILPPLAEQEAIAAWLDEKCQEIDAAIAKVDREIELIDELKQSEISRVVTRGLNPDAPLRPSGIDWIGDIPSHWKCIKIKHLSPVLRGASPRPIDDPKYFDENGEFSWVRIADVTASERYLEITSQRLSTLGASLSVKRYPGDLFLSIAGTVGKPIITRIKCCIHDGFVWFPLLKINPEYLYYVFMTGQPYRGLGKFGTQLNLNTDTVGNIFIPLPPSSEIELIVRFLDKKCAEIDELKAKLTKKRETLAELRQSIISEVVTGKRKVI